VRARTVAPPPPAAGPPVRISRRRVVRQGPIEFARCAATPPNWPSQKGEIVAHFRSKGLEVSKALIAIDALLPQITSIEERAKLLHWMRMYELANEPDPERRRELLKQFDACPCCGGWLGHNNPPPEGLRARQRPRRD
jgi:hypothetical protein